MGKILQYMGDESGASAAEYALILALIAVALITALFTLRNAITGAIDNTASDINQGQSS